MEKRVNRGRERYTKKYERVRERERGSKKRL